MTAIASTSRVMLGRTTATSLANRSVVRSSRHFSSSSDARSRSLVMAIGNSTITLALPSLSSLLASALPAAPTPARALAGIPTNLAEEDRSESEDILTWDGFLNAVPKSKVSHSRKAMRQANKGLKDRVDFVHCAACGKPKLAQHICSSCFSVVNRTQKAEKRLNSKLQSKAKHEAASKAAPVTTPMGP